MNTSNPLSNFLATGHRPSTTKATSALLDQLRNKILTTNNQNEPMTSTSQLTKEFIQWKRTNPNGTAAQFTAWKTSGGKASPTIASHCAGLDPANLPRMATGQIDSLAITNKIERQKQADRKALSNAVSAKRLPGKIVINRSKYSV
jgi:hypothetical protein